MMISGVNSADYVQNTQPDRGTQSIDQKIRQLKEEIRKIKGNKWLPAKEKEEKIKKLEQQIKELEEQKKRMKKKESQNDDSMKGNSENKATDERVGNNIDIQA